MVVTQLLAKALYKRTSKSASYEAWRTKLGKVKKEVGTYSLRSPRQNPFCCSLQVSPMALQIPQDGPSVYLWEHLLYRFDRRFSFSFPPSLQLLRCRAACPAWLAIRRRRISAEEEVAYC